MQCLLVLGQCSHLRREVVLVGPFVDDHSTIGAFSDRVHNVAFDAFGYLDLSKLTITK